MTRPALEDLEQLPAATIEAIDRACSRFEQDWKDGGTPRLEDYCTAVSGPAQAILFRELLLLELEYRHGRGEVPSLDDYALRFPHQEAVVRQLGLTVSAARTLVTPMRTRLGEALTPQAPALPSIPGYSILRILGQGGMGVVYQARDERLNRLVALKMVLAGAQANAQLRARFHLEAEALAALQHPNIVEIFEVGEHNGCPYLAMELVEGGSLDRVLEREGPQPPSQVARLIELLARAMHRAHQCGIVHRDLKPANVLLSPPHPLTPSPLVGEGGYTPKITDFGLAKRLEEAGTTQTGSFLGTPAYMAPEQTDTHSNRIGPAVDVYALGVVLYELLTGVRPFRAEGSLETLLLVRSQPPQPLTQLRPRVPRDLETICLKCLEKQPDRRYPSAEALADDLRRFLAGEPIHARPVGRMERLVKWARRKPAAAALIGVSVAASVVVAAVFLWSYVRLRAALDRTERRSQLARTAVDDLYVQAAERWLDQEPHKDPVQREFLEKALKVYEELADEAGGDPSLRQATGRAHFRRGQIYRQLGRHVEAEQAYQQAIALQHRLSQDHVSDPTYRQELADSHNWLGELYRTTGRFPQALEQYQEALKLQEPLTVDFPGEGGYRQEKARSYYNQGLVHLNSNRPDQALESLETAIAILKQLTDDFPDHPDYRRELARCYLNRGPVLRAKGLPKDAERSYDQAIALYEQLKDRYPGRPDYRIELAVSHNNRGNLLQRIDGRRQDAEAAHGRALALLVPLTTSFPGRPSYREELANTHNSVGAAQAADRKWAEAERSWQEALELFRQLVLQAPAVADYHHRAGLVLGNLGWLEQQRGNPGRARKYLESAIAEQQAARKQNPEDARYRQALQRQRRELDEIRFQLKEHPGR